MLLHPISYQPLRLPATAHLHLLIHPFRQVLLHPNPTPVRKPGIAQHQHPLLISSPVHPAQRLQCLVHGRQGIGDEQPVLGPVLVLVIIIHALLYLGIRRQRQSHHHRTLQ